MSKISAASGSLSTSTSPRGGQIRWQWSRFGELSTADLYAVVRLREAVFVVEQNCPYPDADGRDPSAWHLLGWSDRAGEGNLVAYARVFEAGVRYVEASMGRIVTSPEVRGTGLGRVLVEEGLRRLDSLARGQRVKIAAQERLEKFYAGFGFTPVSAPYDEDGIRHVDMIR
ncbi:MAG TPA: GNAT family N-acetyltransferase [Gemmatimonadaceae bacterium]|nr:GNAT family N-acetyltransferase [Gemmatimonadaceae bacterium]